MCVSVCLSVCLSVCVSFRRYTRRRLCVCVCLSVCLSVCVSFRRYTRRRLWSDRDQILHTHADSSPNGSELNKNQPRVTQGGFGGF